MTVFLVLAALGLGVWIGERDTLRKRAGWRYYSPSTNPLRDYK